MHPGADRGPAVRGHGELTAAAVDEATVGRVFRDESGRAVAALVRAFGDIDLAEDAVQDAFAVALRTWPGDGLPPNPGGWVTTTARRRAIDRLRRETRGRAIEGRAAALAPAAGDAADDATDDGSGTGSGDAGPVADDRLRLIFTCCHPALAPEARIALTLRLLGGLTTAQVAAAFLVPEPTMAKRLVRAKHKIRAARIPYRVPTDAELVDRLPPVLAVLYLVYTTGAGGPSGAGLRAEAIRLTRIVAGLMPDQPEVAGLLALLLLTEARQPARYDDAGALVRLADQDRSRWDRALVAEGRSLVDACVRRGRPGPYQLQAGISAVHAAARSIEATDWPQILALYDRLLALAPTPVVALNRAVAVAEVDGPEAALPLVDRLDLDRYHLFHATRADLLRRLGRPHDARPAYRRAADLAPSAAERAFLRARIADLGTDDDGRR